MRYANFNNDFFDEEKELAELKSDINRINDLMQEQANESLVRITERQFKEVFLPFFAGEENLPYKVDAGNWEKIAGGPFKAVNVVNEYGEVLFQVPPLLNREAISVYEQEGEDALGEVLGRANNLMNIFPARGRQLLNHHFAHRLNTTQGDDKLLETIEIWNKIFKRYNKPLIIIKGINDKTESVSNTDLNNATQSSDGLDYEIEEGPI